MLGREWNGQVQRVAVLANGFAWNGKTRLRDALVEWSRQTAMLGLIG